MRATPRKECRQMKLLVLVDGSASALRAVREVIKQMAHDKGSQEVHLLNVQHALPGTIAEGPASRAYHHDQGIAALADARAALDEVGVPYTYHIGVGDVGEVVAQFVAQLKCDEVVMGTRGMGAVANVLLGSAATDVLHLVNVPVLLVK